ncbi:MAG TPA: molybdenum ABC transporter ATP-binding protein [Gammaproteobacteria bacterium]
MSRIDARFQARLGAFRLNVDLHLPGQGVIALFGHSGSGKTTVLRAIAGLERFDGTLVVNGDVWQDEKRFLPVHKRPIGYVFQEASLFSHLSVERNLAFGLKRIPAAQRRIGLEQVVEWLGIGHLLSRKPQRLSGGERQRVAIARALLTSPRLLLMDEPLSALDTRSKADILPYLERLHDELSIPVLYVSHSPDEVARLADHLVLMEQGQATAAGPVTEMMTRLDLAIAREQEAESILETTVAEHQPAYHLSRLDFPGGSVMTRMLPAPLGTRQRVRIHARDVSLALSAHDDSSILNVLPAKILEFAPLTEWQVLVRLGLGPDASIPLLARITRCSAEQLALAPGKAVYAQVKTVVLAE